MDVPEQDRRRRRREHHHTWAERDEHDGYDVVRCACGREELRPVTGRQLELFAL